MGTKPSKEWLEHTQGAVIEEFDKVETRNTFGCPATNAGDTPHTYIYSLHWAHENLGWVFSESSFKQVDVCTPLAGTGLEADAEHPSYLGKRRLYFHDIEGQGVFSLGSDHPDRDRLCRAWLYEGL
jgi:hypothetical protein